MFKKISPTAGACGCEKILGMKKFDFKNLRDVLMFGKVLSAGLVVAGYAFLSVWCANWLNEHGWPLLISLLAIPLITGFGVWQAWLFMTSKNPLK